LNIPKEELEKALKLQPKHHQLITIREFDNGGKITVSTLQDLNENGIDNVFKSAEFFAKQGKVVDIMPTVRPDNKNYKTVFKDLLGTDFEGKSPDLKVDGKYYEVKGHEPNTAPSRWLKNMLGKSKLQAEHVILKKTNDADWYVKKRIKERIVKGQKFNEVWILNSDGTLYQVFP
jgi:hypothetical protein